MATISGGAKLVARLAELSKNVTKSAELSVGFMSGATYPDGTLVSLVAVVQEFGAPSRNVPPRPFFRQSIARNSGAWPQTAATLLEANNYDAAKTLSLMGEGIKGQIQDGIKQVIGPPLKPATIARKGFSTLLIDSSHMLNSVDWKVE